MLNRDYTIILDFTKQVYYPRMKFVQGDKGTCKLSFNFAQTITTEELYITFELSDGSSFIEKVANNTLVIPSGVLGFAGEVNCQAALYNGGDRLTNPVGFSFTVVEDLAEKAIESSDHFPILTQLINDCNSIIQVESTRVEQESARQVVEGLRQQTMADFQTNIDAIAENATISTTKAQEALNSANSALQSLSTVEGLVTTFQTDEATRVANELDRISSEQARVNAENLRVQTMATVGQDITSINAQLDDKATKATNEATATLNQVMTANGDGTFTFKTPQVSGGISNVDLSHYVKYDAVVAADGSGTHITLESALATGVKKIFVKNGIYNESVTIRTDGVQVLGESKENVIFRVQANRDGLTIYANNCIAESITVDCETNNAEACFVIGDGNPTGTPNLNKGNYNKVRNCVFKGSDHIYALYLAGASYNVGFGTLNAYENDQMSNGNSVTDCVFYTGWTGDSYSISLQKNAFLENNIFNNGRIAFYMNKNTSCVGNKIFNSLNQGIFAGCPIESCIISENQIYYPASTGIRLENQLEHAPLLTGQRAKGNVISNNTITHSGNNGIDLVGTKGHESILNTVSNNTIISPAGTGIYMHYVKTNVIDGNTISYPRSNTSNPDFNRASGIYMVVNVQDNVISNNNIFDDRSPAVAYCGIGNLEDGGCTGNIISGNNLNINNTQRTIWIESNYNTITGNNIQGGFYAGIRLNNGASYNVIEGNQLRRNTNETNNAYYEIWVQNGSSNNIISGNIIRSVTGTNKAHAGINIDGGCDSNKLTRNMIVGTTNQVENYGTNTDIL